MKKIFAVVLLAFTLGANAFWNNNDMPWNSNNYNGYGYAEDNGIFAYNPYDYWDPRWYMEEMSNMVDEFDDEFNNDNYYNGYYPYNNSNTPWGNNTPWNNNGPWNNGPWNNQAPVAPAAPVFGLDGLLPLNSCAKTSGPEWIPCEQA